MLPGKLTRSMAIKMKASQDHFTSLNRSRLGYVGHGANRLLEDAPEDLG